VFPLFKHDIEESRNDNDDSVAGWLHSGLRHDKPTHQPRIGENPPCHVQPVSLQTDLVHAGPLQTLPCQPVPFQTVPLQASPPHFKAVPYYGVSQPFCQGIPQLFAKVTPSQMIYSQMVPSPGVPESVPAPMIPCHIQVHTIHTEVLPQTIHSSSAAAPIAGHVCDSQSHSFVAPCSPGLALTPTVPDIPGTPPFEPGLQIQMYDPGAKKQTRKKRTSTEEIQPSKTKSSFQSEPTFSPSSKSLESTNETTKTDEGRRRKAPAKKRAIGGFGEDDPSGKSSSTQTSDIAESTVMTIKAIPSAVEAIEQDGDGCYLIKAGVKLGDSKFKFVFHPPLAELLKIEDLNSCTDGDDLNGVPVHKVANGPLDHSRDQKSESNKHSRLSNTFASSPQAILNGRLPRIREHFPIDIHSIEPCFMRFAEHGEPNCHDLIIPQLQADPKLWKQACMNKKGLYRCIHCPSKFRNMATFAAHLDENQILRPFVCAHLDCPWAYLGFFKRSEWVRHIRIQHNQVLDPCPICEKEFLRKDSLKRHISRVHGPDGKRMHRKRRTRKEMEADRVMGSVSFMIA
jgi:hypothetical protein